MDEHQTKCISLVHSPRNMLAEELARGSPEDSDNCTGLAMTTLVSSLNREPDRPSNTATANPQSPHQSSRGPTPLGSEELTLPGHINSGVQSRTREFQEKLSKSYAPHGEEVQRKPTLQPGESGIAGVVRGRSIPF